MEQLNEERRLRRGLGMGPACGLPRLRFFSAAGGSAAAVPSTKSGDNRFPLPFRALFTGCGGQGCQNADGPEEAERADPEDLPFRL